MKTQISSEEKDFLLLIVYVLISHGKYDRAEPILESLHKTHPDDYHLIRSQAYMHLCQEEYGKALAKADAAMHPRMSNKERTFSYLIKSKALWRTGKTQEARENIEKFLASRKTHS